MVKPFEDLTKKTGLEKSEGVEIDFNLENGNKLNVYTTRPDTIFGSTFLVLAPEHHLSEGLVKENKKDEYNIFLNKVSKQNERERLSKEKIGFFTGSHAINPITNEKIPHLFGQFCFIGVRYWCNNVCSRSR